tara:strand:- start:450 stop:665 length:216 start_codon:yes stop_codon:yes gene_type:complete
MMSKENQSIVIGMFLGFTIGVCSMMFISQPPGKLCYDIIEEIEYQVCEECWYDVFDGGEKYQEVQEYITWE